MTTDHCPLTTFFVPATRSGILMMANCDHLSSIKAIFAAAMSREPPWGK
jgi:hypothetical protein